MKKEEALIARVLDLLARRFDKRAVLRGGMVLRILGSPRFTNDLDYLFIPYRSKKDLLPELLDCLQTMEEAEIKHSMNSKCLRIVLTVDGVTIQIEAKAALSEKTTAASTRLFSKQFNLPPRMVRIADLSVALAHKMAAWNERRLVRDLYDIWFYLQMSVLPDREILAARLRKPEYSRRVSKTAYFAGSDVNAFYDFLREKAAELTDEDIRRSLADYLAPDEIDGLAAQFRAALAKLR